MSFKRLFNQEWIDAQACNDSQRRVHLKVLQRLCNSLISEAREAAKDAISYRPIPFQVGAAGLFFKSGPSCVFARYKIFTGANFKPFKGRPGNDPTLCAEKMALEWAKQEGYEYMVAMAIAGDAQEDSVSKLKPPTLHCCHCCRVMFEESDLVGESSLLITVDRRKPMIEVHTVGEILRKHNGNNCGQ